MSLRTIILIACVGKKADKACAARELYQSAWFIKARRYAEQVLTQEDSNSNTNDNDGHSAGGDSRWYILSAAHHLLEPGAITAPYNKTLNTMPIGERREWVAQVYWQLRQVTDPMQHRLVFLAGQRYRVPLAKILEEAGYTIEVPMQGLGIGKQLAWLNDRQISSS